MINKKLPLSDCTIKIFYLGRSGLREDSTSRVENKRLLSLDIFISTICLACIKSLRRQYIGFDFFTDELLPNGSRGDGGKLPVISPGRREVRLQDLMRAISVYLS